MITLDVAPYCNYCSKFVPVSETSSIVSDQGFFNEHKIVKTVVRCEHNEECQAIYRYLSETHGLNAGGSSK